MKILALEPDDSRWRAFLDAHPHDLYHLPGYVSVEAARMGGRALALVGTSEAGEVLLPLVIRDLPPFAVDSASGVNRDATSPYGYPGPIVGARHSRAAADLLKGFLDAARQPLRDLGVACVFVRLNPVLNESQAFSRVGTLVSHGETVWLDLSASPEELNRQTRERFRSNISAARRDGLEVEHDPSGTGLAGFVALYQKTMQEVGADSWYLLSEEYFRGLVGRTEGAIHLFAVRQGERPVAAGLFSERSGIVQYLFSGKDEAAGHPHATKLLMVHVRDWAKARGATVMHLGGGLGGGSDSLGQFKRGFSRLRRDFHTWRWIVDDARFWEATRAWEERSGRRAEDNAGFFPPYRKPI